jgi:hypothetical protein
MGSHLGWFSTVGCPLRGGRGGRKQKSVSGPPKTKKDDNINYGRPRKLLNEKKMSK